MKGSFLFCSFYFRATTSGREPPTTIFLVSLVISKKKKERKKKTFSNTHLSQSGRAIGWRLLAAMILSKNPVLFSPPFCISESKRGFLRFFVLFWNGTHRNTADARLQGVFFLHIPYLFYYLLYERDHGTALPSSGRHQDTKRHVLFLFGHAENKRKKDIPTVLQAMRPIITQHPSFIPCISSFFFFFEQNWNWIRNGQNGFANK